MESRVRDLQRMQEALQAAAELLTGLLPEAVQVNYKPNGDPVTIADRAADRLLRQMLLREDEGWLSEESKDDQARLGRHRVWVVDPLDGTKEFVAGIPEWCVSVGLVEDGAAVAGGVCNPLTAELFLGSLETGVTLNGERVQPRVAGVPAVVLASRSEVRRGEWQRAGGTGYTVCAMGSVAYKLARVAAGLADATWTLCPKHEWDVAAGVALVTASGGLVKTLDGQTPRFNCVQPLFDGLMAFSAGQRTLEIEAVRLRVDASTSLGPPHGAQANR